MTAKSTATAATAVTPSSSSRCSGAMSMTSVARTHVIARRDHRGEDAQAERAPVAAGAARLERAEQDRDEQHGLDALAEEDA